MDQASTRGPMHTPAAQAPALRTTYPGGTEHTRAVRADLRAALRDCPRADDVILCASELAANAAQHSRSRLPGGTFTVRAVLDPDHYARIEVQDDGGPWNQGMIDPPGTTAWISSVPLPTSGASTGTTSAGPAGLSSHSSDRHARASPRPRVDRGVPHADLGAPSSRGDMHGRRGLGGAATG